MSSNTMLALTREECLKSCPGVFLSFVHEECLWAFAPDRVMRWSALAFPEKPGQDLWKSIPHIWDFGSRVIVPEFWAGWLASIAPKS